MEIVNRSPTMPLGMSQTRNGSPRVDWVDYSKGLGIFFVVFGHVLGGLELSKIVDNSASFQFTEDWLYSFHMPLFFLISGMFVRHSSRRSTAAFITDKLAVLVWPYLIWSLIQGLLETSNYGNHQFPVIDLLKIVYLPIGQYWFLYTLFLMMMMYLAVIKLTASDAAFFCLAVLLFVLELVGANATHWGVAHAVASSSLYFALGILLNQAGILTKFASLGTKWLLLISLVGYLAVAVLLLTNNPTIGVLSLVRAALGITGTVALAICTSRSPLFGFVRLWGVLSLEIYVAHVIAAVAVRLILLKVLGIQIPLAHLALGVAAGMYGPIVLAYFVRWTGFDYAFTFRRSRSQPSTARLLPTGLLTLGRIKT